MNEFTPAPSCQDDLDAVSLGVDEARLRLLAEITSVTQRETLPLAQALNRVLAEDLKAPLNVPPHTNSAMDGYALRACDLPQSTVETFRLIGQALAGQPFSGSVQSGECVRITTGAPIPTGTDTVVIQERVQVQGEQVRVLPGEKPGQNVRQAGEDLAAGSVAIAAGRRLWPADLGLIASLGVDHVSVLRRPRVAILSTGDELRRPGETLTSGAIYDSNRQTLRALLERVGVEVQDLGICRDEPEALRAAFNRAAQEADVLISSGGVSVGEADYVKDILAELGAIRFWQVAMKPGRPLAFGRLGNAWFFGLPGNPVAVVVTFYQLVQPALRRLMGETPTADPMFRVRCRDRLRKKPGRSEFQRGLLSVDAEGQLSVGKVGAQGSGILTSVARANCFIVLSSASGEAQPGDFVNVQPFHGLM